MLRILLCIGVFATSVASAVRGDEAGGDKPDKEPSAADIEFFEKKIRPLLSQNCFECHGEEKQKGNLRLDSHEAVLKGGDSGPSIKSGEPNESLLIEAIMYQGDTQMPPKGKLSDDEIAELTDWVKRGAPWPKEKKPDAPKSSAKAEFNLQARRAKQWAFQPLVQHSVPQPKRLEWARSPVDQFLLARLEAAGLAPAPDAEKRTLLRRVTFDLIGLPPTPGETAAFLADESPEAFSRVVDRLLASPHYGERWGRHWLDLVRYAETCGHEFDFEIPFAYEYRDYIIRALNLDLPYNQLVLEHVAGDLLAEPRRNPQEGFNESIIGTGFYFLGEAKHSPVDVKADEADRVDNQIDVFSKTFLACTMGCARCHDHKFDAISQKDYYALAGYIQSSRFQVACVDSPAVRGPILAELEARHAARVSAYQQASSTTAEVTRDWPKLLLASLAALRAGAFPDFDAKLPAGANTDARVAAAALHFQVDLERLKPWATRLQTTARQNVNDPLFVWAKLTEQTGPVTSEAIAAWRGSLLRELEARASSPANPAVIAFEDFAGTDFGTWSTTGDAFGNGPLHSPYVTLSTVPLLKPGVVLGTGIAHSGTRSPRLHGGLRSPTFTIQKPRIAYHVAGTGGQVRLIVDGLRLIQNPIYGGLAFGVNHGPELRWHEQNVEKWVGHNAWIEVLDDGDGDIALDKVLFTDGGIPPQPASATTARHLLQQAKWETVAQLAEATRDQFVQAAGRWSRNEPVEPALLQELVSSGIAAPNFNDEPRLGELHAGIQYRRKAVAMLDGTAEDEHLFLRGSSARLGELVPRRLMEAVGGTEQPAPAQGSGRLELAQRMIAPTNPLLARVIVNRVWKQHFGEGIVRTPDDFGNMGQPPTHPELLDYLAAEFMKDGWSLKKLHRKLLLSRAWQMSSQPADAMAETQDPENKLWHRMPVRRLEAEGIRDAMLAVSGRLDLAMYGPSVMPHLTPFMIGRGRPGQTGPLDGAGRRSLYIGVRRNFLTPLFLAFDYPSPFATIGRRSISNVPAQALALMNNPFVIQQAETWAKRVQAESPTDERRIQAMYAAAYTRPPTPEELREALEFVAVETADPAVRDTAWRDLAHVLLNVKEFIFVN